MFFFIQSDEQNGFVTMMFLSGGNSGVRRWDLTDPIEPVDIWLSAFSNRSDVSTRHAPSALHTPQETQVKKMSRKRK